MKGSQAVWLFQGMNLIVEDDAPGGGLAGGSLRESVLRDFKGVEIFEVPALEGPEPIAGALLTPGLPLPPGWQAVPIRQSLAQFTGETAVDHPAGRMIRALHIAQWRADSRFCGSCGTQNIDAPDEPARLCPACGRMEFPRIAPAVIILITNDRGEALLAHNKNFPPGMYSLIAGFTEAGESLESTVAREVREEVNIEVKDIRYIVSQPWPFPHSLMLGFTARRASGELRPDGIEIEDAQWFPRDKLPLIPGHGSVSRFLIDRWAAG